MEHDVKNVKYNKSVHGKMKKQSKGTPKIEKSLIYQLFDFLILAISFSGILIACQIFINRFCLIEFSIKTCGVFIFQLCLAFFLAFIAFILPKGLKIFFIIFSQALILLIFAIQICYFGVFSSFASLDALMRGTEALSNFSQIVKGTIIKNRIALIFMLCFFILNAVFVIFLQKRSVKYKKSQFCIIFSILFCVFLKILSFFYILACASLPNSAFIAFTQKCPINEQVASVGIFHSILIDAKRNLPAPFKISENIFIFAQNFIEKIENFEKLGDPNSKNLNNSQKTFNFQFKNEKTAQNDKQNLSDQYNILPIDFEKLLLDNSNEEIHQMDKYFANLQPTKKNEYTGIFEGKNLIYITAESFSPYCIREDLTPTLYKMLNEGFNFTHFYTPYWEISTTDGEYVNCTGLLPKLGTYSFKDSAKNYLPFALGNQFKRLGYTTKAYHNYLGTYYERNLTHPNLGYEFYSMGAGYRETKKWPDSDFEMMQETLKEYIECEPFHVYYMTISGHLPYDFYANAMAIKNEDLVKNLEYDEAIRAFFACNIELDRALGYLLETLNEYGIAENTVIALAADHWPYGLEPKQLRQISGKNLDVTFGLFENAFILYNPGQRGEIIEKYCCNLDIIPTLSNLFALEFDSRLLMGNDIFSDSEPFIILKSTNVITDKLKYNGSKGTAVTHDGKSVEQAEIDAIKEKLKEKLKYSALILENDYYKRIFSSLEGN